MGPDIAGRVLLLLTALGIPFCLLICLRWLRPNSTELAFLAFPWVWNKLFFKGNLAFLLGIGMSLLAYGWIRKDRVVWRVKDRILALFLCLLVYFCHGMAFGLLALILLVSCPWAPGKGWIRKLGEPLFALLPGILLMLGFLVRNDSPLLGTNMILDHSTISFGHWVGKILRLESFLWSFHPGEWELGKLWMILAFLLWMAGMFQIRRNAPHIVVFLTLFLLYLVCPLNMFPLVRPHERVFWFMFFFSPLTMEIPWKAGWMRPCIPVSCCGLLIAQSLIVGMICRDLSERLEASRDLFRALPERECLVSIGEIAPAFGDIKYGSHLESYYILDRKGTVRSLFSRSYQLIQYRDGLRFRPGHPPLDDPFLLSCSFCLVWHGPIPVEYCMQSLGFHPFLSAGQTAIFRSVDREDINWEVEP